MKPWNLAVAMVLGACASGTANLPTPPAAPIHDNLVVPGVRIGPVALGMSAADFYKVKGNPLETSQADGRDRAAYRYADGFTVWVESGRVTDVAHTTGTGYRMAEGLTRGSSQLEATARLGKPCRIDTGAASAGVTLFRYRGLTLTFRNGNLESFWVHTGTC